MTRRVLGLLALLTAVLTATLTGCTAPAMPPPTPPTTASTTPTPTTGSSATTTPAAGSPVPTAAPGAPGPVVARRSASLGGAAAELQLYGLVRDGTLVHLTFGLTSATGMTLNREFSAPGSADFEADGITLIDGDRRKLYLVASHGDGECLCSSISGLRIGTEPTLITATFAAPPAATKVLDVSVPRFGVFSGVPVR